MEMARRKKAIPSISSYMARLRSRLEVHAPLTFKAEESLVRALTFARDNDLYCFSDAILLGLLEARSAAIPVLDTLGVPLLPLSHKLRSSALQTFDGVLRARDRHHFTDEFEELKEGHVGSHVHRTLDMARRIALHEGMKAIDSATLLRSIFQEDLMIALRPSEEEKAWRAATPLNKQLLDYVEDGIQPQDISVAFQHFADWFPDINSLARLEDSIRLARTLEPFLEVPKFIVLPTARGWRVRNFDFLNLYGIEDANSKGERAGLAKINVVAGPGVVTWDAIEEFEQLLEKDFTDESAFQRFFARNPRFLLGDRYCRLHSQIVLLSEEGDLIPDFFVERPGTQFADILELKRPSARIIAGSGRRRGFSAELTRSLNQVREYRNFFESKVNREEFYQRYGFKAYRPSVCIVIGRSWEYIDHLERIQIEDEYSNLRLLTYDDILAQAKHLALI